MSDSTSYGQSPQTQDKSETLKIMAVANQKGGVGKTTTAINLATAMSAIGKKVLLVDMDPQGNASTGLGVRRMQTDITIYDVLFDAQSLGSAARETRVPNLHLVSSTVHLAGAELELVNAPQREARLKQAIDHLDAYDFVIIDCPPSLNLLTLNALVAAHSVLVPLQCEFYALEGLSQLTKTIERVRKRFNPDLEIEGVVLTMYDPRNNLSGMVADDVRQYFGDKVYKTVIPRNVRVSEAPSHGLPAIVYDMRCAGARAYIDLAKEMLRGKRSGGGPARQQAA